MKVGTAPVALTPEFYFLRGQFALHKFSIPYFMVTVQWDWVIDYFELLDDLPQIQRMEWPIKDLFQRELNWDRVRNQISRYLKNDATPQFFNAMTVALLPRDGDALAADFSKLKDLPPMQSEGLEPKEKYKQIGGIQLAAYEGADGAVGRLRWDKQRILAVAVDGQHRLAAIRDAGKSIQEAGRAATSVPVILLIPHKDVGFVVPPTPTGNPTTSALRGIFTDLNKHAKVIPKAREILLDDQDLYRVCAMSLVDTVLRPDPDPERLPLGLIDWITDDKNKVESGPFVTTTLQLESLVLELIGDKRKMLSQPLTPVETESGEGAEQEVPEDVVEELSSWLETQFGLSGEETKEVRTQVNRCVDSNLPITWQKDQLDLLRVAFERKWRDPVVRIFRDIGPYKELWSYSKKSNLLSHEFISLYANKMVYQGAEAKKRAEWLVEALQKKDSTFNLEAFLNQPLAHIQTEIKKSGESWFYKMVWQRAIFRAMKTLSDHRHVLGIADNKKGSKDLFDHFAGALSGIVEIGLDSTDSTFGKSDLFWEGIGLKAAGKAGEPVVDYSAAGCERLSRWLVGWAMLRATYTKAKAPAWSDLSKKDDEVGPYLDKLFGQGQSYKGFERVLKVSTGVADEKLVRKQAGRRYDWLVQNL